MVNHVPYREVQYFRQSWLLVFLAAEILVNIWAVVQQIVLGQPWGNNSASDGLLLVIFLLTGVILPVVVLTTHLRVEVRREGVVFQFFPMQLHERTILWRDIPSHVKVPYRPLRDFGGWGIRYGRRGKAYNVSGDQGVALFLGDGREMLFGSRDAQALELAIGMMRGEPGGR